MDLLNKSPQIVLLFFLGIVLLSSLGLIVYSIIFSHENVIVFVAMVISLGTAMAKIKLHSESKE